MTHKLCYIVESNILSTCFSGTVPLEISWNTLGMYFYCSALSISIDYGKTDLYNGGTGTQWE